MKSTWSRTNWAILADLPCFVTHAITSSRLLAKIGEPPANDEPTPRRRSTFARSGDVTELKPLQTRTNRGNSVGDASWTVLNRAISSQKAGAVSWWFFAS